MNKSIELKKRSVLLGLFIFLIPLLPLLKAQLTSEQIQTANLEKQQESKTIRRITSGLHQKLRQAPAKTFVEKLDFRYAAIEGFDLNVPLKSSSYKGSFYTEQEMTVAYTDRIKKDFIYRLSYDLWHFNYYNTANRNILEQDFKAETALRLIPKKLFLETNYRYEIFRRQHAPITMEMRSTSDSNIISSKTSFITNPPGFSVIAATINSKQGMLRASPAKKNEAIILTPSIMRSARIFFVTF